MTHDQYLERKVAGLCVYSLGCMQPCDGESLWCKAHGARQARYRAQPAVRKKRNANSRRWRDRRWRLGLCSRCPAERDIDSYFCIPCNDTLRAIRRESRHAQALAAPAATARRLSEAAHP